MGRRRTRTLQHLMTSHCNVILSFDIRITGNMEWESGTYMFIKADAAEVLPKSKNHGLKPSEEFLWMMRKCWKAFREEIHWKKGMQRVLAGYKKRPDRSRGM